LLLAFSDAVGQIMPRDLVGVAREHGCGAVQRFFDRPGPIDPPYLYGYLPGEREESAAFWCQVTGKPNSYLLVFIDDRKDKADSTGRCPTALRWSHRPRGLSVTTERNVSLDGFRYVDDPSRRVQVGEHTDWAPIQDSYDGLATLFYCYKGRWVFNEID